jgi:hypothetical protein
MMPGRSDTFYYRCDFALMSLLGGLIGYIWFAPQDAQKALGAGLGWTAALNVAATNQPRTRTRPPSQSTKTAGKGKK